MSITPLSAARIVGELGLAGGTITGGCCAAHYGKQLGESGRKINEYEKNKLKTNGDHHQFATTLSAIGSDAMSAEDYCKDRKLNATNWNKCEQEIKKVIGHVNKLQGMMTGRVD